MKNKIKLLSGLLIVIFSISLCTISAFAVPDDDVIATQPVVTEPVATEPVVTTPEPTEIETMAPTVPPTTKATKPKTEPTTKQPVYTTKPATTATQYQTQSTQYYTAQATVAPTQPPILATDGNRVDEKTLNDSDWEDIKNQLLNNGDDGKGADNFDFIHNNSDNEDNGMWLLVTGIVLVVIGVAVIAFWIVYGVKKKRCLDKRKDSDRRNNRRPSYEDNHYPRRDRRETTPYEKRQINRRSKYDTGEVELPRNRHSQNRPSSRGGSRGNGTRYRR